MNETTITGYISRDRYEECCSFSEHMPIEDEEGWIGDPENLGGIFYAFPKGIFPQITWKTEPQPVELTIKLIA